MQAFENKDPKKIPQITIEKKKDDENRTSNQGQVEDLEKENLMLQTEVQKLKMMLTDQKKKSKELQMSLAGEIVVLQEEIESQAHAHLKVLDDRDELARQELEKFKQGCQQREK
jgi:phage host-nuclease inhibitor protein Gam